MQQRLAPATWQETAKQELVTVLPILRQAPRHLERVATLLERGELGAHISLFADDRDVAVVSRLVNRVVLGLLGMVALASVGLLAVPGGPQLTRATSLLDLFGYMGRSWPPCSSCEWSWQPCEKGQGEGWHRTHSLRLLCAPTRTCRWGGLMNRA